MGVSFTVTGLEYGRLHVRLVLRLYFSLRFFLQCVGLISFRVVGAGVRSVVRVPGLARDRSAAAGLYWCNCANNYRADEEPLSSVAITDDYTCRLRLLFMVMLS